jgi:hypothetical protein
LDGSSCAGNTTKTLTESAAAAVPIAPDIINTAAQAQTLFKWRMSYLPQAVWSRATSMLDTRYRPIEFQIRRWRLSDLISAYLG